MSECLFIIFKNYHFKKWNSDSIIEVSMSTLDVFIIVFLGINFDFCQNNIIGFFARCLSPLFKNLPFKKLFLYLFMDIRNKKIAKSHQCVGRS